MPRWIELPRGVSLFEKLLEELPEAEAHRARDEGFDYLARVWILPDNERKRHPANTLTDRLIAGDLIGTGVFLPIDPHRPRKLIPPELWDHVLILFDKSELLLEHKKRIINVEVLSEEDRRTLDPSASPKNKLTTDPRGNSPVLTDEGVLLVGEERLVFRGQKQRRLVELLIQCSETGGASTKVLLERAGFSPSVTTLDRAFQGNPSWALLRSHLSRKQGIVTLDWNKQNLVKAR
jgi:hypothetical protein